MFAAPRSKRYIFVNQHPRFAHQHPRRRLRLVSFLVVATLAACTSWVGIMTARDLDGQRGLAGGASRAVNTLLDDVLAIDPILAVVGAVVVGLGCLALHLCDST